MIIDLGVTIDDLKIGEWTENEDGGLSRVSLIPEGIHMEEAERIVSQTGCKPSAQYKVQQRHQPSLKPEW